MSICLVIGQLQEHGVRVTTNSLICVICEICGPAFRISWLFYFYKLQKNFRYDAVVMCLSQDFSLYPVGHILL
ncbi:MAG: hypothetical protein HKUEN01_10070 [Candidatus Kuenenia stuttgartiensis]|nr:MAG: hypothetical protein HKUEN01_10070 [Candidatus Kuenenia stuttgartiensis]